MDQRFQQLRRRLEIDPADPEASRDLARAYAQSGELFKAYTLLVDHPAIPQRDPLMVKLGRQLVVPMGSIDSETRFAVAKEKGHWIWRQDHFLTRRLPILAIKVKRVSRPSVLTLKSLNFWPLLRHLDFSFTRVNDNDMAFLAPLQGLKSLKLTGCRRRMSAAGLASIAGLPLLQELNLRSCTAGTDLGLAELRPLSALKRLELRGCSGISEEGLRHLSEISTLRSLSLSGEYFTEAMLDQLAGWRSLKSLEITDLSLNIDQARKRLSGIEELSLSPVQRTQCERPR